MLQVIVLATASCFVNKLTTVLIPLRVILVSGECKVGI